MQWLRLDGSLFLLTRVRVGLLISARLSSKQVSGPRLHRLPHVPRVASKVIMSGGCSQEDLTGQDREALASSSLHSSLKNCVPARRLETGLAVPRKMWKQAWCSGLCRRACVGWGWGRGSRVFQLPSTTSARLVCFYSLSVVSLNDRIVHCDYNEW